MHNAILSRMQTECDFLDSPTGSGYRFSCTLLLIVELIWQSNSTRLSYIPGTCIMLAISDEIKQIQTQISPWNLNLYCFVLTKSKGQKGHVVEILIATWCDCTPGMRGHWLWTATLAEYSLASLLRQYVQTWGALKHYRNYSCGGSSPVCRGLDWDLGLSMSHAPWWESRLVAVCLGIFEALLRFLPKPTESLSRAVFVICVS